MAENGEQGEYPDKVAELQDLFAKVNPEIRNLDTTDPGVQRSLILLGKMREVAASQKGAASQAPNPGSPEETTKPVEE